MHWKTLKKLTPISPNRIGRNFGNLLVYRVLLWIITGQMGISEGKMDFKKRGVRAQALMMTTNMRLRSDSRHLVSSCGLAKFRPRHTLTDHFQKFGILAILKFLPLLDSCNKNLVNLSFSSCCFNFMGVSFQYIVKFK